MKNYVVRIFHEELKGDVIGRLVPRYFTSFDEAEDYSLAMASRLRCICLIYDRTCQGSLPAIVTGPPLKAC